MAPRKQSRAAKAKASPSSTPQSNHTHKVHKEGRNKVHKRSRDGCFTCRLRRKKCDEREGQCGQCIQLGTPCEYSQPTWWSDSSDRFNHKEYIKDLIKRGKAVNKPAKTTAKPRARILTSTPPTQAVMRQPVYFSTPDSITLPMHPRLGSTFPTPTPAPTSPATIDNNDWAYSAVFLDWTEDHKLPAGFEFPEDYEPFELDTTFLPNTGYQQQEHLGQYDFTMGTNTNLFQQPLGYNAGNPGLNHLDNLALPMMEIAPDLIATQSLQRQPFFKDLSSIGTRDVQNFGLELPASVYLTYALKEFKILPILDLSTGGAVKTNLIKTNTMLTPGLLTTGARFRNFETGHLDDGVKQDLYNFRSSMLSTLITGSNCNIEKQLIIQAGLMGLYFQTLAGACKMDEHRDLSFDIQLGMVIDLFTKEDVQRSQHAEAIRPLNIAMTYWFDILGATLKRRTPIYQNHYDANLNHRVPTGLSDLMGCDDVVMYTIASIAHLDADYSHKRISEDVFVARYKVLDHDLERLQSTYILSWHVQLPDGTVSIQNLQDNITKLFLISARVYLLGVMPDNPRYSLYMEQVDKFVDVLSCLPRGTNGWDQCLAWPFLIVGAVAGTSPKFRKCFTTRYQALGALGELGSLRAVKDILDTVWTAVDDGGQAVTGRWRNVIDANGWKGELIV